MHIGGYPHALVPVQSTNGSTIRVGNSLTQEKRWKGCRAVDVQRISTKDGADGFKLRDSHPTTGPGLARVHRCARAVASAVTVPTMGLVRMEWQKLGEATCMHKCWRRLSYTEYIIICI